jgi:glycosyltransferase involved in cell wall biosynthesis
VPPNQKLAITIPTYNRAELLECSLATHVPIMSQYSIPIYISDNASSDSTKEVVEKWQQVYPLVHYHRNNENLGLDKNFEIALKMPNSDYVWLLGDGYKLTSDCVERVIDEVEKESIYDCVVVNLDNKISIPSNIYNSRNNLLEELSGLMSCLSCLVFSKELISEANFSRYYNSYFIQTGIIFDYIENRSFSVCWIGDVSVEELICTRLRKINWSYSDRVLEIGVEAWANLVFSLGPMYMLSSKLNATRFFGDVSGLLTYKGIFVRRSHGAITYQSVKKHRRAFLMSAGFLKLIFAYFICFIPVFALKKILLLKRFVRK